MSRPSLISFLSLAAPSLRNSSHFSTQVIMVVKTLAHWSSLLSLRLDFNLSADGHSKEKITVK